MKLSELFETGPYGWGTEKQPKAVVRAGEKPEIVPPTTGGFSKHPYQNRLVGTDESTQDAKKKRLKKRKEIDTAE